MPRSRKSAEAVVDFEYKFNGDSNTITLKKGLALVGAVNNTSYTFSIPEDVTVNSPLDSGGVGGNNSPRTGKFSGLTVYQGTLLTKKFIVNGSSDQRFILDNSFIDLDSLRVEVRKSGSSGGLAFSRVDNIIEVTPVSNVFLIQEIKNETYELLFGDGLFGKKLEIGDVIDISYIVTDGKDGNEGKFFTFSGNMVNDAGTSIASTNNVQVIATQTARNGTDIEPIDSIRYFAPRMYSAQNRAVTPRDYEAIIQSIYPNTESVSVVGGEELDPPEFGTVVLI